MDSTAPEAKYDRPPITEAVIGITFSNPINSDQLDSASTKLQANYPHKQAIADVGFSLAISSANPEESKADLNHQRGYRLSTADQTQLVVLRMDSFSFSQLAPYCGWLAFIERFERDWNTWKRLFGFQEIKRIGARYINRLDIPVKDGVVEHEQFLNIYPRLPDFISPVDAYAVQILHHLKEIDCQLAINSASVPSPLVGYISFVIDIDIYTEQPPQKDNDIFSLLDSIRKEKNKIFEACITNHSRKLFQ